MTDYEKLLDQYREIWNNRKLQSDHNAEEILKEAITRDLKDENAHPRARRNLMEKFFLSTKRIIESDLTDEGKLLLIELHKNMAEEMKNGGVSSGRSSF